jgi:RNA polymerase sigma-70 factor (ECF subfamily)
MEENDRELLRAVLAGDKDAYRPLVVRHSQTVFRVAFRITGNEADAEEVVQEVFLRAYLQLPKFELRADFGTWIYRIAVNCSLDALQKQKNAQDVSIRKEPDGREFQPVDRSASPERLLLSGEIESKRSAAMKSLTEIERTAFILRHLEDCSMEEIAGALGMTANSAKQAVFRAVQKLRQALTPLWAKS